MKSFFTHLAVAAALATTAFSQFTINTPLNVVVCQPALISWVGGVSPFFLVRTVFDYLRVTLLTVAIFRNSSILQSILPANQPSAAALVDLGQQTGNSVTWLANLGVGTGAFLNLRDSTGTLAQSGTFTVQTGSNTTCVGQAVSASSGGAATAAPGAPAATGAPAAPVASPTPAGNSSPSASAPSAGSASTASHSTASTSGSGSAAAKPTSGALSKFAGAGAAAFVGSAILSIVV